jgi:hypothetical protein
VTLRPGNKVRTAFEGASFTTQQEMITSFQGILLLQVARERLR